MKRRRSISSLFQEDYCLNTAGYDPLFPGIRVHSFCHSRMKPDMKLSSHQSFFILISIILSGRKDYLTSEGDHIVRQKNYFQIADLNNKQEDSTYRLRHDLERYFILVEVNHVLRQILSKLFPAGLPQFQPENPARLISCFEDVRKVLRKKGTTDDYLLSAMCFKLLTEAAAQNTNPIQYKEKFSRALRYLDNKFCDPALNRREVAEHVGISVVMLGKLFQQNIHTTFGQYLLSLRMEKAVQLLEFSEKPISAISTQCGFATASYFTKVFRKEFQVTPAGYRTKIRKENQQK